MCNNFSKFKHTKRREQQLATIKRSLIQRTCVTDVSSHKHLLLTERIKHDHKNSQHGPQTHPYGNLGYRFLNANCKTTNWTKTIYFKKFSAHTCVSQWPQWPAVWLLAYQALMCMTFSILKTFLSLILCIPYCLQETKQRVFITAVELNNFCRNKSVLMSQPLGIGCVVKFENMDTFFLNYMFSVTQEHVWTMAKVKAYFSAIIYVTQ
jgi:hypothetical protein